MTRAVLQAQPELRGRARALRERAALVALALLLATLSPYVAAQSPPAAAAASAMAAAPAAPGASALQALFAQHCAVCHENPATRAPSVSTLSAMAPSFVVGALTDGIMQAPGAALTPAERTALAEYLTGKRIADEVPMAGRCAQSGAGFMLDRDGWNGWGNGIENARFQPRPAIPAEDLPKLGVAWAFGIPGAVAMFGQPTVAGGRVFVGAQNGHVYSLDARTGCYYWDYTASTGVRTAITVARVGALNLAFFGDRRGNVYAVDVATGKAAWKVAPNDGPRSGITGAPVYHEGRLYVPYSGGDDSAATDPKYECCQGRGAVFALDAATGRTVWSAYTIDDAKPLAKNAVGTQLWGPSGASVWTAPTIDAKRGVLYVGTGDNHSAPATDTSDAVLALALDTGKLVWKRQLLAGDMGNAACLSTDRTNCPEPPGPDFDIGTSPNLVVLPGGKRMLVVGQKSGMVYGLDPDEDGRVAWSARVAKGGLLGGVQWGTATDGRIVYAAASDIAFVRLVVGQPLVTDPDQGGGLTALRVDTGAVVWRAPPARACAGRASCSPAQSAAVTATLEYVLSGSVDGHLRAYAAKDGAVLWDFDTARPFPAVNGIAARGGALDAAGATLAGGMLFVGSGYGLYGGQPGNVLIAFAPRR